MSCSSRCHGSIQQQGNDLLLIQLMFQRKSWMAEEDEVLKAIVDDYLQLEEKCEDQSINWHIVSQDLKSQMSIYKTPKQCQDRWKNHLKPGSKKETEWSSDEQLKLFNLQEIYGNKWTLIASHLPGRSDSTTKNFFYATLRKSIRIINAFITNHRNEQFCKNMKLIQEGCVGKIIAQDQGKTNKMRVTKSNIAESAHQIKTLLLEISRTRPEKDLIEKAIMEILDFNRSCRRLRCKRKQNSFPLELEEEELLSENSKQSSNHSVVTKSCKSRDKLKNKREQNVDSLNDYQQNFKNIADLVHICSVQPFKAYTTNLDITQQPIGLQKSMEFTRPMQTNHQQMESEFEHDSEKSMREDDEKNNHFREIGYGEMKVRCASKCRDIQVQVSVCNKLEENQLPIERILKLPPIFSKFTEKHANEFEEQKIGILEYESFIYNNDSYEQ